MRSFHPGRRARLFLGLLVATLASAQTTISPERIGSASSSVWGSKVSDKIGSGPMVFGTGSPMWRRYGTVIQATTGPDNGQVQEPTVIYEGNGQILNASLVPSGKVFKMWYSAGYPTAHMSYAESYDGATWSKYPTVIVNDHTRAFVLKISSTYYMYALGSGGLDLLTSSDGVSWTLDTANVLIAGGGGAWDSNSIDNVMVLYEGPGVWKMVYEANNTVIYRLGLATSTDGRAWTKYGGNPVLSNNPGSVSSPWITKQGSTYYMWAHVSTTGFLPSDMAKYSSSDLISWTRRPSGLALQRTTPDEGEGSAFGQIADPTLVEVDGHTYLFYSSNNDGTTNSGRIGLMVADVPLSLLVHSDEGAFPLQPKNFIPGSYPLTEAYQNINFGSGDGDANGKNIYTLLARHQTNTNGPGNYFPRITADFDSGASFGRNTEWNFWASSASAPVYNLVKMSGKNGVAILGKGLHVGGASSAPVGEVVIDTAVTVGGGARVTSVRTATASYNFGTVGAGSSAGTNVTVTGAAVGDMAYVTPTDGNPWSAVGVVHAEAVVTASNNVAVFVENSQGGGIAVGSRTFRVTVISF